MLPASSRYASRSGGADWRGRGESERSLECCGAVERTLIQETGNLMVSEQHVEAALDLDTVCIREEERDLGVLSRWIGQGDACSYGIGSICCGAEIRIECSSTDSAGQIYARRRNHSAVTRGTDNRHSHRWSCSLRRRYAQLVHVQSRNLRGRCLDRHSAVRQVRVGSAKVSGSRIHCLVAYSVFDQHGEIALSGTVQSRDYE